MDDDQRQALGRALRARREDVGLTQEQVGELAEVNRATVRTVEVGKPIGARTLANIKRALGCVAADHYGRRDLAPTGLDSPVLTANVAGIVARGLLSMPEGQRASAVRGYHDVLQALSERALYELSPDAPDPLPLGEDFRRWRDTLRAYVPEVDMRAVETELADKLGVSVAEPAGFDAATALRIIDQVFGPGPAVRRPADVQQLTPAARPEVQVIADASVSNSVKGAMFEYLGRRRAEVDAALLAEITTMVRALEQAEHLA